MESLSTGHSRQQPFRLQGDGASGVLGHEKKKRQGKNPAWTWSQQTKTLAQTLFGATLFVNLDTRP